VPFGGRRYWYYLKHSLSSRYARHCRTARKGNGRFGRRPPKQRGGLFSQGQTGQAEACLVYSLLVLLTPYNGVKQDSEGACGAEGYRVFRPTACGGTEPLGVVPSGGIPLGFSGLRLMGFFSFARYAHFVQNDMNSQLNNQTVGFRLTLPDKKTEENAYCIISGTAEKSRSVFSAVIRKRQND